MNPRIAESIIKQMSASQGLDQVGLWMVRVWRWTQGLPLFHPLGPLVPVAPGREADRQKRPEGGSAVSRKSQDARKLELGGRAHGDAQAWVGGVSWALADWTKLGTGTALAQGPRAQVLRLP